MITKSVSPLIALASMENRPKLLYDDDDHDVENIEIH